MSTERSLRSNALDLLRFPLAIIIVTDHVFGANKIDLQGQLFFFDKFEFFLLIKNLIHTFIENQSVPIYFFIAGYVFFHGIQLTMEKYIQKMYNRFRSLFIPYIAWNTIAIIFVLLPFLPVLGTFFPRHDYHSLNISLGSILNCFALYNGEILGSANYFNYPGFQAITPIDRPLWFLQQLIIVALLTPIINEFLKRFGNRFLLITGLIWFFTSNAGVVLFHAFAEALFFFSFGAYLSIQKKEMITEFQKYFKLSIIVYFLSTISILILIYTVFNSTWVAEAGLDDTWLIYLKNVAVVAGLVMSYNLSAFVLKRKWLKVSKLLASSAFFIYAAHQIFIPYLLKVLALFIIPDSNSSTIMLFVICDIIMCGGLLLLYAGMRRFTPSILKPFTGGRL